VLVPTVSITGIARTFRMLSSELISPAASGGLEG